MSMHGERSNPALSRLEPPSRPQSPHTEFANGYSLGLIGGVRSWVSASNENITISDGRGWTGVDGCVDALEANSPRINGTVRSVLGRRRRTESEAENAYGGEGVGGRDPD